MSELRECFEKWDKNKTWTPDESEFGEKYKLEHRYKYSRALGFYAGYMANKTRHTPKHETVDQWEKRTGETYPDDRLVWSWEDLINMWTIITYEKYKEIMDKNFDSSPYIFIHTEQFETQSKEMKNLLNDIKNEDMQNWMDNGRFSLSEEIRERIQKVVGDE